MDIVFNHSIPLQIRFNDIDMLGHLNNSVYFNFFDLGKARYFEAVKGQFVNWQSVDIVVANLNADFLAPVFFNESIAVRTTVTELGNKSLRMLQQIVNTDTQQVKCCCTTIMVGFDIKTGMAQPISSEWKEEIMVFENNSDLLRTEKRE